MFNREGPLTTTPSGREAFMKEVDSQKLAKTSLVKEMRGPHIQLSRNFSGSQRKR